MIPAIQDVSGWTLSRCGIPKHPRDLLDYDCIRTRFASGALTAWEFEKAGEKLTADTPARLIIGAPGTAAAIDLAVAGRGLIYTFRNWLDPHLMCGALMPVLPDWWPVFEGPRLYFPVA